MRHYTYLLFNGSRFYIGVRSCKCEPEEDYNYLGSMKDQEYRDSVKSKTVLRKFPTRKEAVRHEVQLHKFFDVGRNPKFANRAKQTNIGFDTSGVSMPWKGIPKSEEHKRKVSESKKGSIPWNKGISMKKSSREKLSKSIKRFFKENPEIAILNGKRRIGFKHSEESRLKMSKEQTGLKNGRADKTLYVFQHIKNNSIICDLRYNLKTKYGIEFRTRLICGKQKSVKGYRPLFCPISINT